MSYNYDTLKQLAKERGCKVSDLLALSSHNDPFYTGTPGEVEGASWFSSLFHQFYSGQSDVHLRRIHYRIVSQDPPVLMPDGTPYENTERCWDFLTMVSKHARYLGYVNADAFADKRNQEPSLHASFYSYYDQEAQPGKQVEGGWVDDLNNMLLPELPSLPELPELPGIPTIRATGYTDIQQGYLIELWVEKTTINDVLEPLCQRYGCNLVTGAGELSITAVRQFLRRARSAKRPARILYISDYDPAGLGMPISIARKVEFYQRNDSWYSELDIKLQPIVLTEGQVARYRLPRVPVKDSDKRKDRFEQNHGEGQVELDALEALHPGQLAEIVEAEILRYYDPELKDSAEEAKGQLQQVLDGHFTEVHSQHEDELEAVDEEYASLVEAYSQLQNEFSELVAPFAEQIRELSLSLITLRTRVHAVYSQVQAELEDNEHIDLKDYPLPEPDIAGDPDSVLYESERDYEEQLDAYRAQRDGSGY